MRRITGGVFQSLDGVMQAPGGPTEDPTGGFALGGWLTSYFDKAAERVIGELFSPPFDLLLGRKTYEIFAAHWPYATGEEAALGEAFTKAGKYVLTRGGSRLDWANSHALPDLEAVAALKASDGPDLIIQGSTTLYPQLLGHELVDRLILLTFPVVLGSGKRLFGKGTPAGAFRLIDQQVSSNGVVIATYEPAGSIPIGSFQHAQPSEREVERQERMRREG